MKLSQLSLLLTRMLLVILFISAVYSHNPAPKIVSQRCPALGGVLQSKPCLPGTMLGLTNGKFLKYCCRLATNHGRKVIKRPINNKGTIKKSPQKQFVSKSKVKKKPVKETGIIGSSSQKKYVSNKKVKKKPIKKTEAISNSPPKKPIKIVKGTNKYPTMKLKRKKDKCKNASSCKKAGGRCIPSKRRCVNPIPGKCKGKRCICCHKGCKKSKKCSSKGGACTFGECKAGYKSENGCKPGCNCCVKLPSDPDNQVGQCGKSNPNRIVGGKPVYPANKYPWHVWLLDSSTYLCGGTIIYDRHIITAGHCICSATSEKGLKVVVADHKFDTNNDDIKGVTKIVNVENVIRHPDHSCSGSQVNNDIALLVLSQALDLCSNKQVRAICLPTDDSSSYAGEDAIVIGWGLTDPTLNKLPSILQEVTVPVLDPSCPGYSEQGIDLTDNMICAGVADAGLDSCSGDSGGPLMVNKDGSFILIGVVSFGPLDCKGTGTYTRVTKFLKWIDENTNNGQLCT